MSLKYLHKRRSLITAVDPLVTHYTFENNSGLIIDEQGNNHATAENGVTRGVLGKIGNGISLDGVDDYVSTPIDLSLYGTFSIALWFKTTSTETRQQRLISHFGTSSSGSLFIVSIENGKIFIRVNGSVSYNGTFNDGNWHFLVVNFPFNASTTTLETYVDNVQLGISSDTNTTLDISSSNLDIGNTIVNANTAFQGSVDEFRFYNKNLNSAERSALFTT